MPPVSKTTLKSYFETGDTPTQDQFAALIDHSYNQGSGEHFYNFDPERNPEQGDFYKQENGSVLLANEEEQLYSMYIQIPDDARYIHSIRMIGGSVLVPTYISNFEMKYFTDINGLNIPGVESIGNPMSPLFRYTLTEEYQLHVNTDGGFTPQHFNEWLSCAGPLDYNKYRYLVLKFTTNGLAVIGPIGIKYK